MRQRHSIRAIWAARTPERGAFTLIELMVAVAILSVMIMIFSGILAQVQRVMNLSNDAIRTDRIVVAVDKLLRRDIASISKSGFLKITGGNHIAFATVGSFESMAFGGGSANAATIDYGLTIAADDAVVVPANDNSPPESVIWRRLYLLIPGGSGDDQIDASLADAGTSADPILYDGGVRIAPEIKLPPTQASHWGTYVAENCTNFYVWAWTAADQGAVTVATATTLEDASKSWTVDGLINAAVRITSGPGTGQTRNIVSNTSNTLTLSSSWKNPLPTAASTYSVLGWVSSGSWDANSSNWPEAIRVRYMLEGKLFEVITNIE